MPDAPCISTETSLGWFRGLARGKAKLDRVYPVSGPAASLSIGRKLAGECLGGRLARVGEQAAEIARGLAHAAPAILGFGLGVVVRIRVDVVGERAARFVDNELDAGDLDTVRGKGRRRPSAESADGRSRHRPSSGPWSTILVRARGREWSKR